MSLWQAFMTVIPSVLVGTIIYVITKFILDNLLEQRKVINDIANALIYYSNIYCASIVNDNLIPPVSDKFRELSARLSTSVTIIPGYSYLELFLVVRKADDIKKASKLLMRISNSIAPAAGEKVNSHAEKNELDAKEIEQLLKIT